MFKNGSIWINYTYSYGEDSKTPTEPHHTPTSEASQSSQHELPSPSLPPVISEPIPTVIPTVTPPLRQYTRRDRIAQSLALLTVADEPASPIRDGSQGEACPTVSGLEAGQDRENIIKTSTFPHESTSRVTSLAADEGNMQHQVQELLALCASLQRQLTELVSKFEAQELEITSLEARIKLLKDKDGGVAEQSGDDALIKGRILESGEETGAKRTEKGSDDTEEMVNVLTFLDAATVLSGGVFVSISPVIEISVAEVPNGSGFIPTASPIVPTGSDVVPSASPIFTTATVATPYIRRKVKEKMVESDTPKKKL
nr:hypothetical protein [Tanacetum cinerariifolium]